MDRRPVKSRETSWARSFAKSLAKMKITPNQISVASVFCSALTAVSFYLGTTYHYAFYFLGSVGIGLRLLCNLFDGMVAVEHGKATKSGAIFNDAPDRFADVLIIMGAAHGAYLFPHALYIGWFAATSAVLTAYVRTLGATAGTDQFFMGPMAKPQRMFFLIVAGIIETINGFFPFAPAGAILYGVVILIGVGSFFTVFRRLHKIVKTLESN